ncbi:MAG: nitrogen regulatory protein P-II 1 [Verrucomicrobia bacterium]|jgi:nitrogen regulatory protein P-II 1|nr:MAG: nitrogen regulatory protein P-II 1 [Verrucomicrobiota bacterium]
MKKVEAIIKPYLLEDVRDSLTQNGFVAMTVSEIRRFRDLDKRLGAQYFGSVPIRVDFDPGLKVEVVVPDHREEAAIEAIQAITSSAPIWVQGVQDVIRIRTNEHGELAV